MWSEEGFVAEPVLCTEVREKEAGEQYKWGGGNAIHSWVGYWVLRVFSY